MTSLGQVCPWLTPHSPSGIWRLLDRLAIHWKRARFYIHSPDPEYEAKLAAVEHCLALARDADGSLVTLYQDEVTIERQPTLAPAYPLAGPEQPLARRSYRTNTLTRLTGTLDPLAGRVVARRCAHVTVAELVAFYQQLVAAYPQAERIYLIQDNWPVHRHPDLVVALEPQESPFPAYRLTNWPTEPHTRAIARWGQLQLPIQLVPLPTYASWLNPIEKLWRKLKQDLLHLHRLADDLAGLRAAVDAFLAQFVAGSPELLRYVGLLKED